MKIHNIDLYSSNPEKYSGGFINFTIHSVIKNVKTELLHRAENLKPMVRLISELMDHSDKHHVKFHNYIENDVYYDDILILPINRSTYNISMIVNIHKKEYIIIIRENAKILKNKKHTSIFDLINDFNSSLKHYNIFY